MKTNRFKVATQAPRLTLLQAAVLPVAFVPMAFVPMAAATQGHGSQRAAIHQRPAVASSNTNTTQHSRLRPAAASARRSAKRPSLAASPCATPRGVRVQVSASFEVTNSDDGFKDNDVEVYGAVKFNGQPVFGISKAKRYTTRVYSSVDAGGRSYDVIYNVSSTGKLSVDGFLLDHDKGSGDDAMWNPRNRTRTLNIKEMSQRAARSNSYTWEGDRNSESADLKITVSRMNYIY